MPKVSIIVPVYNTERYFDQCAQSLLSQTFQDIEIIFVNDGSQDNCPAMCDSYLRQRPDIVKVIHQENQGQNSAWNNGLDAASGRWVCFVDSDDWAEPDMVETMLGYAERYNSDISVFGHFKEYKNAAVYCGPGERVLTPEEKANFLYTCGAMPSEAWGRLFRRSFIEENSLRFYPGRFQHEDTIFNLYAFHLAGKVSLHAEALYRYRMVDSGFMNSLDGGRIEVYYLFIKRYGEFVDKYFDAETGVRMKNRLLIFFISRFADYYSDLRGGFTRSEAAKRLKGHFGEEPFRTAIKEAPLTGMNLHQRINILLLKSGLVRIWFSVRGIVKRIKNRRVSMTGYE